jgi:hypothetical protein
LLILDLDAKTASRGEIDMRAALAFVGAVLLLALTSHRAIAQSPQFVPAYPLYCAGPLTTGAPAGGETTTPFKWASVGAGAANPGPGQCVWADRGPRGVEILPGGGNLICDFSGAMRSVPAGTFVEIGVARDPLVNNCMHLARYIGTVAPPFSAVPALPPFVRQSIAALSATQIASLRHGIQVMMSRPVTDPTSYRFQADIHGTTDSPTTPAQTAGWNQCEHGSFYFTAWHRMYLYFFDRILRAAAGDPNLVLPYWDWTNPAQRTLPVAFRQPGDASNALFIAPPGRPAALDAGTASLSAATVDDSAAFADLLFESGGTLTGDGFGGQSSAPMQFANGYGDLEMQPHNVVHSALGGLMGDPLTAAQDPIFWLHHANVDRLWNRWIQQGGGRTDPTDAAWLNTRFTFYDEAGHAVYLTGAEIVATVGQLNYRYDDDPVPQMHAIVPRPVAELPAVPRPTIRTPRILAESPAGAGRARIALGAAPVRVEVPLPEATRAALRRIAREPATRVFLRFDDARTEHPPSFYYAIFIDPPAGQRLTPGMPGFVGNLSLFSLVPHRMPGGRPMPTGDIFVDYSVSRLLGRIVEGNAATLTVVLVPQGLIGANGEPLPLPAETAATIGSVRLVER